MKTLVNKTNPEIRITAPEIELDSEGLCYIIPQGGGDYLAMWKCYWTLVEEDTNKREKLKSELFEHKNITYDAYENDSDPYVGVFFEQLADIVESIYENTDK